jgi:L-asparaginase
MVTQAEESYEQAGFIASGWLNPRKARLLLQVSISCSISPADWQKFLA